MDTSDIWGFRGATAMLVELGIAATDSYELQMDILPQWISSNWM